MCNSLGGCIQCSGQPRLALLSALFLAVQKDGPFLFCFTLLTLTEMSESDSCKVIHITLCLLQPTAAYMPWPSLKPFTACMSPEQP